MTTYYLILDDELRQDINRLSAEYERDPESAAGAGVGRRDQRAQGVAVGREDAYEGKQLG